MVLLIQLNMYLNMSTKNNHILFILKLPPPLTGATLMNKYVAESNLLKNNFNIKIIPVSYKRKINQISVHIKFIKVIFYHIILLKDLLLFRPKIVYFQLSPLGYAFLRDCSFIIWLKVFKVHTIYHLHGKGINEVAKKSKFLKYIYMWAFKNSSVICLSNILVSDVSDVHFAKSYIVNNGIPNISVDFLERKNNNKIQVLFLSNLIYSKGIIDFLDSISLLRELYKEKLSVKIVGSEVEIDKFKLNYEISKRNLNDLIEFLGPKYDKEKYEYLKYANVLVYPTLNDAFPIVILEAMQFGIPVIATKEGAIPEIVDDDITGFLVDKHKPEQIAEKLKILFENDELRTKMGIAAKKKFLEKYTIEVFERNLFEAFIEISNELK